MIKTPSIPFLCPNFQQGDTPTPPITVAEVSASLKSLNDGAPGPDSIKKADLSAIGAARFAIRFNLYLMNGVCPTQFKRVSTKSALPLIDIDQSN